MIVPKNKKRPKQDTFVSIGSVPGGDRNGGKRKDEVILQGKINTTMEVEVEWMKR